MHKGKKSLSGLSRVWALLSTPITPSGIIRGISSMTKGWATFEVARLRGKHNKHCIDIDGSHKQLREKQEQIVKQASWMVKTSTDIAGLRGDMARKRKDRKVNKFVGKIEKVADQHDSLLRIAGE